MSVDVAVCTTSPRLTVSDTPGNDVPMPVIVPVMTQLAAAAGACCASKPAVSANTATPARADTAAATPRATVPACPEIRIRFMTLPTLCW
jgi:hypothetical protein